jgi:uncharacterized protein YcbX
MSGTGLAPRVIGHVRDLRRFPVKSMGGEAREALDLRWPGLLGDRQFAFHRLAERGRFPWLTARIVAAMVLFQPRYRDPDDPRTSAILVRTPEGEELDLHDPALLARLAAAAAEPIGLMQVGRGVYDTMPVSIGTTGGLARVDAVHGERLDARRFRLNVLIETEEEEEALKGRRLLFGGGASLLVNEGIPRCAMVQVDPDTAARDPLVQKTVIHHFDNCVGLYAATATCGAIRLGDAVTLLD